MENVASASAGAYHTVVLKQDGSVWQLGVTTTDLQDDGAPTHVMDGMASVSAGDACSAAIGGDGSLWTWGLNHDGRLGTGDTAHRGQPVKILTGIRQVAMANGGTAVGEDGTVWSWGGNALAQIGDGTVTRRLKPVRVFSDVVQVVRDTRRVMVRKSDGTLWGWGAQLSAGQERQSVVTYTPVQMMSGARQAE
jgi:alpha-tubulin suppressor-like RCC1 family protein